jgi:DNA-binding transcriptional regulator YiaG
MSTSPDHLRAIMREYHLTRRAVADLLGVSLHTVHAWLSTERAHNARAMPPRYLTYLQDALARK